MGRKLFISSLLILIMVVGCVRIDFRVRKMEEAIPKRVVAVIAFEDKTDKTFSGFWDIGNGVAAELARALRESGDFVVIEKREKLKSQALGVSPDILPKHLDMIREILGVDAIITGEVNEFGIKHQEGKVRGRVRVMEEVATVKLGIKAIDVQTENLFSTETAEGQSSKRLSGRAALLEPDLSKFQRMNFGDREFNHTTIGRALRSAIDQAVKKVKLSLRMAPYPHYVERKEAKKEKEYKEPSLKGVSLRGRIIKVVEDKFYINCVASSGVKVGDIFTVYSLGEEIIDPLTGESLGVEMKRAGEIKVIEVEDRYSTAVIKSGQGFNVVKVE